MKIGAKRTEGSKICALRSCNFQMQRRSIFIYQLVSKIPINWKNQRAKCVLNAVKKAAKTTTIVASMSTYSTVACPLRRDKNAARGPFKRIKLVLFFFGDNRPFRRNQPLFNRFHHRFGTAGNAQFMKSTVQMVFNRFYAAVEFFGKLFIAKPLA